MKPLSEKEKTILKQLTLWFGPVTAEQALNEALRLEEKAKVYPADDPGRALLKRDQKAAEVYAELLERNNA